MNDRFNNAVGPQVRTTKRGRGKLIPTLAVLTLGAGLQVSTQFFAHQFKYQSVLGTNLNQIYPPWAILQWAAKWHSHYPEAFMRAGSIGILISAIGLVVLVVMKMMTSHSAQVNQYLHGSARWANVNDIRAAGLIARPRSLLQFIKGKFRETRSGVYVGAWIDKHGKQHYLRHNGPEHVLCYAPTRSGKGVGLVVPTLLSWGNSAVITDLKGELWAMTAGWRQKHAGNKVLRFEPASAASVCWNPLDEIRVGTENEVGDIQNLASLIVDPHGKGLENHWQRTSQALLVGVILHALYKAKAEGRPATLPGVDAMLADPSRAVGELWIEMMSCGHIDGHNHPVVGSAARDMMDRPEEEAGSVLSTAKSYLALYRDPIVARSVAKSEFALKDLMHHHSPVSLYIVTQPNDKDRLRPLVRVMVNMAVRVLANKLHFDNGRPVAHYQHRLLMMLDEFPSLGKLEIMQESLAFVAGYGIKCYFNLSGH
jgi:type IV secretion system protein VirD4